MRRIAMMVSGLVMATALPIAAPPAMAAPVVTLGGITVIHGERPGSALVELPNDVDLDATYDGPVDKQPGVIHKGDGRIIAFVLSKATPDDSGYRPTYASWRVGRCLKRGCTAARDWAFINVVDNLDGRVLPAGKYRLHFIADGAPAQVRLELPGLSGKVSLRPRDPITASVKALKPTLVENGGETLFSGGASTKFTGSGFSALSMWVDGDGEAAKGQMGQCIHKDVPPDDRLAYSPACVGADDKGNQELRAYTNDASWWEPDLRLWDGVVGWYATTSAIKRAGAIALWIKF